MTKKSLIVIGIILGIGLTFLISMFIHQYAKDVNGEYYIFQSEEVDDIYYLAFEDDLVRLQHIYLEKRFLKLEQSENETSLEYRQDKGIISIDGIELYMPVREGKAEVSSNELVFAGLEQNERLVFEKTDEQEIKEVLSKLEKKMKKTNEQVMEEMAELQEELVSRANEIKELNDNLLSEYDFSNTNLNLMELNIQNLEKTLDIYEEEGEKLDPNCELDPTYCDYEEIKEMVMTYKKEIEERKTTRTEMLSDITTSVDEFNNILNQNKEIEGTVEFSGLDFLTNEQQWIDNKVMELMDRLKQLEEKMNTMY